MPTLGINSIINLRDFHVVGIRFKTQIQAFYQGGRPISCAHCGEACGFRVKERSERKFKHTRCAGQVLTVQAAITKWNCNACKRTFSDRIPGVLPRKRSSENYRNEVYSDHEQGISKKDLSVSRQISSSTVERWYHDFLEYRVKELSGRKAPMVLGIDEHFFTKKQGYATTFVDLKNHKVFDVVLGRSEASLEGFLAKLPGKENVRVVVIDLSETYRSIVKKHFPNAKIVTDRFHVVRLINHHFLKLWRELDPERSKNRGLLSLMRRHEFNLDSDQKLKLASYLKEVPALEVIYDFKTRLMELMRIKSINHEQAKWRIPELLQMLKELKNSPFIQMKIIGDTLTRWLPEIGRMWRFTKTNSITEGFHTKMEMISRRAYGFRNFKNYRLRVIALCGWSGVFVRRN